MVKNGLTAVGILLLLACPGQEATAGQSLEHLREWVGRYPTYDTTTRGEFLKVEEVRRRLAELVSGADLRFITRVCGKEMPIKERDGYLIVQRCHKMACAMGTALVIVGLADGDMHVALRTEKDTAPRWYSSKGSYRDLPVAIDHGWYIRGKAPN
jgi:hypothetical protein